MKLIVGLGNPGRAYVDHRHNIGFAVVDILAARLGIDVEKRDFGALVGKGKLEGLDVMLAKPQTFMNLSGDAVAPLAGYYKIAAEDIVVVHDDIDIEFGKMKVVFAAGHGGHNGVRSIIETIGGNAFYRIRVGVGRPSEGLDAADYVLGPFSDAEREASGKVANDAADATVVLVRDGLVKAQQMYN